MNVEFPRVLHQSKTNALTVSESISEILESIKKYDHRVSSEISLNILKIFAAVESIQSLNELSLTQKESLLESIRAFVGGRIRQLNQDPRRSPINLWEHRSDRRASPCEWVMQNYPDYGQGLTQADIRAIDVPLYRALHNWKLRYGWPENFFLPSRKARRGVG